MKLPLIWRILIAVALGIGLGYVLPLPVVRIFMTFNGIFSQFISFLVPLIIVGLVTPAICRMGKGAGRMLLYTFLLAYGSTLIAGIFSYASSAAVLPSLISPDAALAASTASTAVEPFFTLAIPPILDVMTALVSAFIFGIFLNMSDGKALTAVFYDLERVVTLAISKILIPLLPLFIFGIFLKMSYTGEAGPIMQVFAKVILFIFALSIVYILALFIIAGLIGRRNPFRAVITMLPAYVTALGTSSSAATIPVTLAQAKKCGVRPEVAGFTVPLCATIHLPGSIIKIVACSLTIMVMQGLPYSFGLFFGFIALLAITMVAAPGVPGGAIMAAIGLIASMLGFSETDQALIIALYIVMDCFGTACNVTCDGAISIIVDRFKKGEEEKSEE